MRHPQRVKAAGTDCNLEETTRARISQWYCDSDTPDGDVHGAVNCDGWHAVNDYHDDDACDVKDAEKYHHGVTYGTGGDLWRPAASSAT